MSTLSRLKARVNCSWVNTALTYSCSLDEHTASTLCELEVGGLMAETTYDKQELKILVTFRLVITATGAAICHKEDYPSGGSYRVFRYVV